MFKLLEAPTPPEISGEQILARTDELHLRERGALSALGAALLRGLPGEAARVELRHVREDLDGLYAAHRILEMEQGAK